MLKFHRYRVKSTETENCQKIDNFANTEELIYIPVIVVGKAILGQNLKVLLFLTKNRLTGNYRDSLLISLSASPELVIMFLHFIHCTVVIVHDQVVNSP